jgi:hypothetical protein
VDPEVLVSALSVTPDAAIVSAETVDPEVILGSLGIEPDAAEMRIFAFMTALPGGASRFILNSAARNKLNLLSGTRNKYALNSGAGHKFFISSGTRR